MPEYAYVWRVETAKETQEHGHKHRGAFNCGAVAVYRDAARRDGRANQRNPSSHPSPDEDYEIGRYFRRGDHFFGMKSLAQLRMWFPSKTGRRAMEGFGMIARKYRLPAHNVHTSWAQAIFDWRYAELVEERSLADLKPTAQENDHE
jgi:hypothetical protein